MCLYKVCLRVLLRLLSFGKQVIGAVDCIEHTSDRSHVDVAFDSDTKDTFAVFAQKFNIGDRFGIRSLADRVLMVRDKFITVYANGFHGVKESVDGAVADAFNFFFRNGTFVMDADGSLKMHCMAAAVSCAFFKKAVPD